MTKLLPCLRTGLMNFSLFSCSFVQRQAQKLQELYRHQHQKGLQEIQLQVQINC